MGHVADLVMLMIMMVIGDTADLVMIMTMMMMMMQIR